MDWRRLMFWRSAPKSPVTPQELAWVEAEKERQRKRAEDVDQFLDAMYEGVGGMWGRRRD